jgi:activator of 2-hydroxyglutaryl-CoA dehydratase
MNNYLRVDIDSVSTKCAIISEAGKFIAYNYLSTQGKPVVVVRRGLGETQGQLPTDVMIRGVCAIGGACHLTESNGGVDVAENGITAQAMAALYYVPDALSCHCD